MKPMTTERPLLFSGPMVTEVLAGRKTMTRRAVKLDRLKVRPRGDTWSDLPHFARVLGIPPMYVTGRRTYRAGLNPQGAVFAHLPRGGTESPAAFGMKPGEFDFLCPYADGETVLVQGDGEQTWRILPSARQRLWVREAWAVSSIYDANPPRDVHTGAKVAYFASGGTVGLKYRHARFMPRWASRLDLDVVGVRLESLHDITEADIAAEGVTWRSVAALWDGASRKAQNAVPLVRRENAGRYFQDMEPRECWRIGWTLINGVESWEANPWVWVLSFSRSEGKVSRG